MFKKILLALVVLVGGFCAFVATRPSQFKVERSVTTTARAETTFAFVNDLRKWGDWSPWEKMDPSMKKTFGGAEAGVGATYAWQGNDEVGKGQMTITGSEPGKISIKLEFFEPWAATNTTVFTFAPAGDATRVTWSMEGENNFVGKAASLFLDMDGMIGGDFEKGLAALKGLAEAEQKKADEAAKAEAERAAAAAAAPPSGPEGAPAPASEAAAPGAVPAVPAAAARP